MSRLTGQVRLGRGSVIALAGLAAAVILAAVLGLFGVTALFRLLILIGLAASWNIVGGLAGQLHLGHAGFFGVGAYAAAWSMLNIADEPLLAILLGGAVAAIGALVLLPLLRADAAYFAIGTLTVVILLDEVSARYFPGGSAGTFFPARPSSNEVITIVYILAIIAICLLVTRWLMRGRQAQVIKAVKADPVAAQLSGVNVQVVKLAMLALSGALAGTVGALYAIDLGYVDPHSAFLLEWSILPLLAALAGGVGTIAGPVIGAFIVWELHEAGRVYLDAAWLQLAVEGVLLVALARWAPNGLMGLIRPRRRRQAQRLAEEAPPLSEKTEVTS